MMTMKVWCMETAARFGVSITVVYRWINRGNISIEREYKNARVVLVHSPIPTERPRHRNKTGMSPKAIGRRMYGRLYMRQWREAKQLGQLKFNK